MTRPVATAPRSSAERHAVILEPALVQQQDAALFLSISPRLLAQLVRRGELVPVRVPGVRRVAFRVDELRALVDRWSATRNGARAESEAV